jgi:hypothetical protein
MNSASVLLSLDAEKNVPTWNLCRWFRGSKRISEFERTVNSQRSLFTEYILNYLTTYIVVSQPL